MSLDECWLGYLRECPPPTIFALRAPDGMLVMGQVSMTQLLREHLVGIYTAPTPAGDTGVEEFLD